MGRYIITGILYKIQFSRNNLEDLKENDFKKRFSPDLFDYSTFSEGYIQLSSSISGEIISKLRALIIDSLDLGNKEESEEDQNRQIAGSSLEELISLAESRDYYSFSEYDRDWMIFLEDRSVLATYYYFGVYATQMKFYPKEYGDHEVVRKMNHLIQLRASDECKPFTQLISSTITL